MQDRKAESICMYVCNTHKCRATIYKMYIFKICMYI